MEQLALYLLAIATELAPFVLTAAAALCVLISVVLAQTINKLSTPESLFTKVEDPGISDRTADTWAAQHGFEPEASYAFNGNIVATFWKRGPGAQYLCRYFPTQGGGKLVYEFVTVFNSTTGLTTSCSRDSMVLPHPPGGFVQCFPDADISTLQRLHEEGRAYLESSLGLRVDTSRRPVFEVVCSALRRQAEFIKALPLWQLRGSYWYFIRRRMNLNRTVQQLHPAPSITRSPEIHAGM